MMTRDSRLVDTSIINKAASNVAGTGPAIRRDALYALADVRSIANHEGKYILKVAYTATLRALR